MGLKTIRAIWGITSRVLSPFVRSYQVRYCLKTFLESKVVVVPPSYRLGDRLVILGISILPSFITVVIVVYGDLLVRVVAVAWQHPFRTRTLRLSQDCLRLRFTTLRFRLGLPSCQQCTSHRSMTYFRGSLIELRFGDPGRNSECS